jgi:hypothetical protein
LLQLDPAGPLFNYAAKGSKVELLGKEDLKGSSVYKIKLVTATGSEVIFFISDTSYHILKNIIIMKTEDKEIDITSMFSDFRKTTDGYIMPYSTELDLPGLSLVFNCKKIEINKELDPVIFEMPKN